MLSLLLCVFCFSGLVSTAPTKEVQKAGASVSSRAGTVELNFTITGEITVVSSGANIPELVISTPAPGSTIGVAASSPATTPGGTPVSCPAITSRSEWGAREPRDVEYLTNQPVQYAFIHHSAMDTECFTKDHCAELVRKYQDFHMDTRKWSDVGYSFLIGGDGTVFEGRGWDRVGAHTRSYNSVGLGFCFIGNFEERSPTQVQLDAVQQLLRCGVSIGKLQSDYTLRGHLDMGNHTVCPGDVLYSIIRGWSNY